ncbi:hypothetical protein KEM55_004307 [Ascosphaera atra]|nr:hypothetical protein KEM55_004307 [Ascosphaera atra]
MRADAAGVEAMLINAMQSSRISRNASANRLQSFEDQLGSFLINPFMDSEDEGGQDVWDAYAAYANLDPEHMEEEGDEDPGIGPAPPVEHDDDDHINPEH